MLGRNFLLTLVFLVAAEAASYDTSKKTVSPKHDDQLLPNIANEINEECFRHVTSILNKYRSDAMRGQPILETNSQFANKFQIWKRNADLINSLLSLPNEMNEAGR